ncbi:hypothetical protein FPRO05_08636 [Fusarium proliferatum]|uniref:Uncharacterized protein n=1 Tax=Gibberella intermedia TaxID=948311 RepID=A0A365NH92_GIBIN|nr:hypothetical protein FPRO05_08636 [Fusarium proliferatum]
MPSLQTPSKLVVAVDFGETNSSVSYTFLPEGVHPESPHLAVRTVRNYPYEISMQSGNSMSLEVPTLMRYPQRLGFSNSRRAKERSTRTETFFTILDAGGGTCDALTYIVSRGFPLRLERQLVHHSGDTCGSNALNDAFRRLLENLLTDHDYLNEGGATLEGHICKLAIHDFEHYVKPVWVVSQNNQDYQLEVLRLRSDPGSQRPCTNRLTIQAGHLKNIYQHICEEVSMLMTKQLHATAQLGLKTGKIVLVGGFGESAPLRSHLREALANFNAAHDSNAQLYVADEHERITAVDAVSSGGVLRALNKLYGPTRVAGSSYGPRCDESFEDSKHAGQLSIQGRQNTQELYVEAIQWLSKKASP